MYSTASFFLKAHQRSAGKSKALASQRSVPVLSFDRHWLCALAHIHMNVKSATGCTMRVSVVFLRRRIPTLIFSEDFFLSPCTLWTVFLVHVFVFFFPLTCTPIPQQVISQKEITVPNVVSIHSANEASVLCLRRFSLVQGVELFATP